MPHGSCPAILRVVLLLALLGSLIGPTPAVADTGSGCGKPFTVAPGAWVHTGIQLKQGDSASVTATGSLWRHPDKSDAWGPGGYYNLGFQAFDLHGKVGNGSSMDLGSSGSIYATQAGELLLGIAYTYEPNPADATSIQGSFSATVCTYTTEVLTAPQAQPALAISPTSGPSGTAITIDLSGFTAGDTPTVTYGGASGATVGQPTISAAGTAHLTYSIPPTSPSLPCTSCVVQASGKSGTASATFSVTGPSCPAPSSSVSPSSVPQGSVVTFTATGFAPNAAVSTQINSPGISAQGPSLTSDANCQVSTPIAVRSTDPAQTYTVTATGQGPGSAGTVSTSASFAVTATAPPACTSPGAASVTPAYASLPAPQETDAVFLAQGFAPGTSPVMTVLPGGSGVSVDAATADGSCTVTATVRVQTNAQPVQYTVQATGPAYNGGTATAKAGFKVNGTASTSTTGGSQPQPPPSPPQDTSTAPPPPTPPDANPCVSRELAYDAVSLISMNTQSALQTLRAYQAAVDQKYNSVDQSTYFSLTVDLASIAAGWPLGKGLQQSLGATLPSSWIDSLTKAAFKSVDKALLKNVVLPSLNDYQADLQNPAGGVPKAELEDAAKKGLKQLLVDNAAATAAASVNSNLASGSRSAASDFVAAQASAEAAANAEAAIESGFAAYSFIKLAADGYKGQRQLDALLDLSHRLNDYISAQETEFDNDLAAQTDARDALSYCQQLATNGGATGVVLRNGNDSRLMGEPAYERTMNFIKRSHVVSPPPVGLAADAGTANAVTPPDDGTAAGSGAPADGGAPADDGTPADTGSGDPSGDGGGS